MVAPKEQEGRFNQLPFSESAKQVMIFAQKEARDRNHRLIGTSHMLLGIMQDPTIIETFSALSIHMPDPETIRAITIIRPGVQPFTGELTLALSSKQVIDLAGAMARLSVQKEIDTVDLLAAIAYSNVGRETEVLESLGFTADILSEFKHIYMRLKTEDKEVKDDPPTVTDELKSVLEDPNIDPVTKDLLTNTIKSAIELARRTKPQTS